MTYNELRRARWLRMLRHCHRKVDGMTIHEWSDLTGISRMDLLERVAKTGTVHRDEETRALHKVLHEPKHVGVAVCRVVELSG